MTDKKKWGTTKNFHLPYPTTDTPVYDTPQVLREFAEATDAALTALFERVERLEAATTEGIVDAPEVAKTIREAMGLPAITVEIDYAGQVSVKAPGLDKAEALLAAVEAIRASHKTESVKRRLRGE